MAVRVLPEPGRHHQQCLAVLLGEVLADASDGSLLVVAFDDRVLHVRDVEWLAVVSPANQGFEFGLLEKPEILRGG